MSAQAGMLQIGEAAERVGLSLRTVRYYEEMGLLEPAQRTEGGFRLYTEREVERLELIRAMKPLGFTVQEMLELLEARDALRAGGPGAGEARERLDRFAAAAAESCARLREQLTRAEALAAQLRAETGDSTAAGS